MVDWCIHRLAISSAGLTLAQVAHLRQALRALGGLKILQILHASQLLAKPNIVILQKLGHTKFCYNFFTYTFIIIIITNIMQYTFSFLQLICALSHLSVTVNVFN